MGSSKTLSDPVHGTIELTELESSLVSARAFQRLRNVKQLGLAHMVFPSADYSRFAHSVGVCHVTGLILSALKKNGAPITPDQIRLYRLAGLLHDVGHYPFSHAMEDALGDHYDSLLIEDTSLDPEIGGSEHELGDQARWFSHERAGKEVLTVDDELCAILERFDIAASDVYSIFTREKPPQFANLVSSDLDADRIDYLLRTAHHTGLPYGSVDIRYLLSQLRLDRDYRICLSPKALRAADHFLIGRYFDYQKVAFHKTVVALEMVLKDVLKALLERGLLSCSAADVTDMIRSGRWHEFDDPSVLLQIRQLAATRDASSAQIKAESIVHRRPPKLLVQAEYLGDRRQDMNNFLTHKQLAREHIPKWANRFQIPEDMWYLWDKAATLTKIGSRVPVSALAIGSQDGQHADADMYEQSVMVWSEATGSSSSITEVRQSLLSVLADKALFVLRVYVILPPERENERESIASYIRSDLGGIPWL